ncbi:glutamyl-tRNA reductase [Dermabacter vaginalis]|uniref:glutamyl-tRNA reductase n=1 Tax=Dermabacter vaginalis TaxID=1630135 RepID=UPI0021A40286|nr:glutamyl-tRNA reductase [Dermabacter vaginalis]MCT2149882.1 glutamyl-tRNA reductase [Dermabacter vaginalis]
MLIALRATHDNLGLEGLERITRGSENLDARLAALNEAHPEQPLTGWVCLATCNRLEVYADVDRFHDAIDLVTSAVIDTSGLSAEEVARMLVVDAGSISARHMYEVASGMNSQVLGEAEITGQVRTTFSSALASGHTTTLLNDLFQGALRTAKQVTSKTKVGAAGRSSVAVALDSAHLFTTELEGREALLIGTGALARVASAELHLRGVGTLRVYSPSGRAAQFAESHGALPVAPDQLEAALSSAAVVIAASGGGTHVIDPPLLERALEARATSEELVILDLALHADVDPAAAVLPGVRVLALESIRAGESARGEVERARELIDTGVVRFEERQQIRAVDPAVSALRRSVKDMIVLEVDEVRRSSGEAAAEQVQRSLGRVYNKLLHSPMVRAQELAKTGQADQFLEAIHTIFGVDVAGSLSVDGARPASESAAPTREGLERPPMSVAKMEQMRRDLEAAQAREEEQAAHTEHGGERDV